MLSWLVLNFCAMQRTSITQTRCCCCCCWCAVLPDFRGVAAALQALAWQQQQYRQQQAIDRILAEQQTDMYSHEAYAPTLEAFALRQVREACTKFGQLLLMWEAGVHTEQAMLSFLVKWGLGGGLLLAAVVAVQEAMASAPGPISGSSDADIIAACQHTCHGIAYMEVCSQAVMGGVAEALGVMQQQAAGSYETTESCRGFRSIMVTRAQCLQAGCSMCSYAVGKCMSLLPLPEAPPCHARTAGAISCAGNPIGLDPRYWSVLVCKSVQQLGVLRATVAMQQQADKDSNSDRSRKADNSSGANHLVSRPEQAAAASQEKDAALEADWLAWANAP